MGLISRVSSRTYREESKTPKKRNMFRRVVRVATRAQATNDGNIDGINTLGFPPNREHFTELKKDEPLGNFHSWDTQRYVNKGVCFYDLIDNMAGDRLPQDNAIKKKISNLDSIPDLK